MATSEPKQPVILHISDLHFGGDSESQSLINRNVVLNQQFIRALTNLDTVWKPNLVCVTGDLAWSGLPADYTLVGQWLDSLISALDIRKEAVLVCPGNHDVNRNIQLPGRRPSNSARADTELKVPIKTGYIERFRPFIDWCRDWGLTPLTFNDKENYLVGSRFVMGIQFVVLNSAWFSRDNSDSGKLWLGLPHIRCMESERQLPPCEDIESSPITVALFHHPPSLLSAEESEPSRNAIRPSTYDYLCNVCHVVLTGHTHRRARLPSLPNTKTVHIEAGATYESDSYYNSAGLIHLKEDTLVYWRMEYDPASDRNGWETKRDPEPVRIRRKPEQMLTEDQKILVPERRSELLGGQERFTAQESIVPPDDVEDNTKVSSFQQKPGLSQTNVPVSPILVSACPVLPGEEKEQSALLDTIKSDIDERLSNIKSLSANLQFAYAARDAKELDTYLANTARIAPNDLITSAYYALYEFEVEHAHYDHPSDLAKAKYYLEKALLYGEITYDADF